MTRRTRVRFGLITALAACSGGHPHVPVAADYDQTCTTNDDCAPVFIGSSECCPECPNDAVRTSEVDRVDADDQKARRCTSAAFCPATFPACPAPALPAACKAGKCQLWQHPAAISVDDYDRSCESLADCAAVFVGAPTCCRNDCPNAAIRAGDVPLLTSDLSAAPASCTGTVPCAPPPPGVTASGCADGRVMCIAGVCAFASSARDGGAADGAASDAAQEQ